MFRSALEVAGRARGAWIILPLGAYDEVTPVSVCDRDQGKEREIYERCCHLRQDMFENFRLNIVKRWDKINCFGF